MREKEDSLVLVTTDRKLRQMFTLGGPRTFDQLFYVSTLFFSLRFHKFGKLRNNIFRQALRTWTHDDYYVLYVINMLITYLWASRLAKLNEFFLFDSFAFGRVFIRLCC